MEQRKLGTAGLTVSVLGLGCSSMSLPIVADERESEATVNRAVELGISFFDTANCYGEGHNERLLGRVLRRSQQEVVIATKFGITEHSRSDGKMAIDGSPDNVKASCDESLSRLGIDTIDLYYLHRVDKTVPIEDTVGAMADLVTQGKVRYLGLCEASATTIRRANVTHPISVVESEWSLFNREPEDTILPTLRELGIGFVPFSPLGRGILTGAMTSPQFGKGDVRSSLPRYQGSNFEHNVTIVDRIQAMATEKGCTSGQLALAWLTTQGDDVVPIPGTKQRRYLEENVASLAVSLSQADVDRLNALVPIGFAAGSRYGNEEHLDKQ
jgi:aryl-alcohol dehydrogenase-like predicted oxidoreductase